MRLQKLVLLLGGFLGTPCTIQCLDMWRSPLSPDCCAVLCWQGLALSGMDGDTEERAVSLGTIWPSCAMGQLWWPWLYLARVCTGVVFLAVPDQAVYRCCVPGCVY